MDSCKSSVCIGWETGMCMYDLCVCMNACMCIVCMHMLTLYAYKQACTYILRPGWATGPSCCAVPSRAWRIEASTVRAQLLLMPIATCLTRKCAFSASTIVPLRTNTRLNVRIRATGRHRHPGCVRCGLGNPRNQEMIRRIVSSLNPQMLCNGGAICPLGCFALICPFSQS